LYQIIKIRTIRSSFTIQKAIKGLDATKKHDMTPVTLRIFLDQVPVNTGGWGCEQYQLLFVITPVDAVNRNMMTEYGTITVTEYQANVAGYMDGVAINSQKLKFH
jgi:hypothetical protein